MQLPKRLLIGQMEKETRAKAQMKQIIKETRKKSKKKNVTTMKTNSLKIPMITSKNITSAAIHSMKVKKAMEKSRNISNFASSAKITWKKTMISN